MCPEAKRDNFSSALHRSLLYRIFIYLSNGRETERNQAPKPLRLLFPGSAGVEDPALLQHLPHVAPATLTAQDSLPAWRNRLLQSGEHLL